MSFRDEKRSNQTHALKTHPDALLQRQSAGGESQWLIVSSLLSEATGTAEQYAAMAMLQDVPGSKRVTWAATKDLIPRSLCASAGICAGSVQIFSHICWGIGLVGLHFPQKGSCR